MKKTFLIGMALLSFQSAFAQLIPRDRDELPMCLKKLDNANRRYDNLQNQLTSVLRKCGSGDENKSELEDLKNENSRLNGQVSGLLSVNDRLNFDNNRLQRDNLDLTRQLEDIHGKKRGLGFFSYVGCKDYFTEKIDLRYIIGSEGQSRLESETNATQSITSTYNCSHGVVTGETEKISTTKADNYCTAGCLDYFSGEIDSKYIMSGKGRNKTEAQYNAMKALRTKFSCQHGIKVQSCE